MLPKIRLMAQAASDLGSVLEVGQPIEALSSAVNKDAAQGQGANKNPEEQVLGLAAAMMRASQRHQTSAFCIYSCFCCLIRSWTVFHRSALKMHKYTCHSCSITRNIYIYMYILVNKISTYPIFYTLYITHYGSFHFLFHDTHHEKEPSLFARVATAAKTTPGPRNRCRPLPGWSTESSRILWQISQDFEGTLLF